MAHLSSGPRPRVRLRLPAAHVGLLLATLALSCVGPPARDDTPAPPSTSTSPAAPMPAATASSGPTVAASPRCPEPCRDAPEPVGDFPADDAAEASGLVSSRRHDDVLYVVDDGPGTTAVLAISATDARLLGRVTIAGLSGVDTEALAAGPCDGGGEQCIYVGDIGDNTRSRDSVTVYRFAEPRRLRDTVVTAAAIRLRYPGRPHDAEALLVDGSGRIGIVTKDAGAGGSGAARLYVAQRFRDGTLDDRGAVDLPLPGLPLAAATVGNVVTGGDWAPGRVALRTYDAIFEFRAPDGRGGLPGFAGWAVTEVAAAPEQQGEAVAYGSDGCTLYTVTEGSGALSAARCR